MGGLQSAGPRGARGVAAGPSGEPPCQSVPAQSQESPGPQRRGSFHDEYFLKAKLGRGTFASVYVAAKVRYKYEEAAVKVISVRSKQGINPQLRRDVAREVACLEKVSRLENVIAYVESFEEGGIFYIVMEKCDITLWQALERMPALTENTLRPVLRGMLRGLASVHAAGVVHRDVKPENFLCCGPHLDVRLCDFGLAAEELLPGCSGLRGIYGTAPFMAVEMLRGEAYGSKVDTWSFGAVAYAIVFGKFPYQGVESTSQALKAAIVEGNPLPDFQPTEDLAPVGPGLSVDLVDMLRSLLSRDFGQRPQAREALNHRFFRSANCRSAEPETVSLRPMLLEARRAGAFNTHKACRKANADLDALLGNTALRRHGAAIRPRPQSGRRQTELEHTAPPPAAAPPPKQGGSQASSEPSTEAGMSVEAEASASAGAISATSLC